MRDWIAVRELADGTGRKIVVRLARPEPAPKPGDAPPSPWNAPCVVEVDGATSEYDVFGIDAFQALVLAHERIRRKLLEVAGISGGFVDLHGPLLNFVRTVNDEDFGKRQS